jgi:hypothetical protein
VESSSERERDVSSGCMVSLRGVLRSGARVVDALGTALSQSSGAHVRSGCKRGSTIPHWNEARALASGAASRASTRIVFPWRAQRAAPPASERRRRIGPGRAGARLWGRPRRPALRRASASWGIKICSALLHRCGRSERLIVLRSGVRPCVPGLTVCLGLIVRDERRSSAAASTP